MYADYLTNGERLLLQELKETDLEKFSLYLVEKYSLGVRYVGNIHQLGGDLTGGNLTNDVELHRQSYSESFKNKFIGDIHGMISATLIECLELIGKSKDDIKQVDVIKDSTIGGLRLFYYYGLEKLITVYVRDNQTFIIQEVPVKRKK